MDSKLRSLTFVVVVVVILVLVGPIALAVAFWANQSSGGTCGPVDSGIALQRLFGVETAHAIADQGPPPQKFIPIYQQAAAIYDLGEQGPSILASIHGQESGYADSNKAGVSSAGAQGPMQFMPDTWSGIENGLTIDGKKYPKPDGNGDGKTDKHNVHDAIYGAALLLRSNGAPKDWRKALFAYNHADWYVNGVLKYAKKYNVPATGGTEACADGTEFSGECPADGLAYDGVISATSLQKIFGPYDDQEKNQVTVTILDQKIKVHKKVAPCLTAVEQERKAKGINYPAKEKFSGYRRIEAGPKFYHGYGAAVDINPNENPFCGGRETYGDQSRCDDPEIAKHKDLIAIFKKHGFKWGGEWRGVKDYMHFEWHGEKP